MLTIQSAKGKRTDLSVGLDAVLQAVELPAGISDLDAALSKVQRLRGKRWGGVVRTGAGGMGQW